MIDSNFIYIFDYVYVEKLFFCENFCDKNLVIFFLVILNRKDYFNFDNKDFMIHLFFFFFHS